MTAEIEQRLPKQMRHWFERAGFYQSKRFGLHRRWRREYNYLYGGSRWPRFRRPDGQQLHEKRFIRVLPHLNRMDICDGNYDRWANSLAASVPMPRDEGEFRQALSELYRLAERNLRRREAS